MIKAIYLLLLAVAVLFVFKWFTRKNGAVTLQTAVIGVRG